MRKRAGTGFEHPGFEARWNRASWFIPVARSFGTERFQARKFGPDLLGRQAIRRCLHSAGQRGVGIDFKSDDVVAVGNRFHQSGADACKWIKHGSALGEMPRQRIGDKGSREACNPRNPTVNRPGFVAAKSRVRETGVPVEGQFGEGGSLRLEETALRPLYRLALLDGLHLL